MVISQARLAVVQSDLMKEQLFTPCVVGTSREESRIRDPRATSSFRLWQLHWGFGTARTNDTEGHR
jgi:hypothetical protein